MKFRWKRPRVQRSQEANIMDKSGDMHARVNDRRSAVGAVLAAAVFMLSVDVYLSVAEARDREGRERASEDARRAVEREQERERERSREREQAQEREREAGRRTVDTQRDEPTRKSIEENASSPPRDGRQSRTSNEDDDKRRADGQSARSSGKARDETKKVQDDELPRTVEEMLRRWTKSLSTSAERSDGADGKRKEADRNDSGRKSAQSESHGAKTEDRSSATSAPAAGGEKSKRPKSGLTRLPPDFAAEFNRVEVLARSSDQQMIARAKSIGFTIASASRFDRLDVSVTRLIAPEGMSASDVEALFAASAIGNVQFNRRYRIYRAATGGRADTPPRTNEARPPVALPTPCGTDRCYGAAALGWQPEFSSCARQARIGVIDTAIDASHHAFRQRRIEVRAFGRATAGSGTDWHGTGVLALLAGDPASDTPGLVHDARFFVANAFYADDDGLPATDTLSLLAALDWLDRQKADIVNMSLAGPPDDLLRDALDRLAKKGMIFVAAAGNEGPTAPPTYPAAYPSVIAVTAVGRDLRSYRYANRGDHIDIAAPGVQIWTALSGARSAYHSGTSFAAPFATATIAAMLPPAGQRSKGAVLQRLEFKDLGEPGRDPVYGNGLIVGPMTCASQTIASSGGSALGASQGQSSRKPMGNLTTSTIGRPTTSESPPTPEKLPWR